MKYSPLNLSNKNILSSNWMVKIKTKSTIMVNSKVSEGILRSFVPDQLKIDHFNGSPRVSLLIVQNDSIAMRFLPFFKQKKAIHLYLQTYVSRNGKKGLFYINVDTNHPKLNVMLKPLIGFPIEDSKISVFDNKNSVQVDAQGGSLSLYGNFEKSEKRFIPEENSELQWMLERFHLFSMQQNHVLDWKLDFSPQKIFEAYSRNLQFSHKQMPDDSLNFNSDCYVFESNVMRMWLPQPDLI